MGYSKKNILWIFLLISNLLFSQKEQIKEIDALLVLSQKYSNINNQKSLDYAKKASVIAEKINNSEKKAYSYIYIAKRLVLLSKPKESLEYVEKSINEDYTDNDVLLRAMIKEVQAYNYNRLGFDSDALSEYYHILTLLKNQNTKEAFLLKFNALESIGHHYFVNQEYKKAFEYLNKAEKLSKEGKLLNSNNSELADLYSLKGNVFLYANKDDSAFFYIKKSFDLIQKEPKVAKYVQYSAMGDYYFKIKNRRTAIDYYLKALDDMHSHGVDDDVYKADFYNRLLYQYHYVGDFENEKKYTEKYFLQNNLTSYINSKSVDKANSLIKKEKEKEIAERQKRNISIILSILFLLTVLLLIGIFRYKLLKKRKRKLIHEKEIQIEQKEEIINKKEEEYIELKQKLIISLDEIKEMAIANNPLFLTKFLETYPVFQKNLIQINPNLQNSELALLAYIYLDFSTKEIADFTFKSGRTIQNRKHHLRKKLGISSSEDLYVWIKANCM